MEDPGLLGKHCLPRHPDGVRSLTPSSSLHFACQAVQTFHVPRDHNQYHRVDGKNPDVEKELEKVLLVPLTHAVIDPRTMVVHSPNAPLAYSAVMGPAKSKRKLLHFIWNFQQYMIFLNILPWWPIHFTSCANGPIVVWRRDGRMFPVSYVIVAEIYWVSG